MDIKKLFVLIEQPDGTVAFYLWNELSGGFAEFIRYHDAAQAYEHIRGVTVLICGWGSGVDGFYETAI